MVELIPTILFYAFAGVLILSAVMVISARNPVHAVLFLIFSFFNAAGLFLLIGAEYLAMTLVIVYVGAVAVLFLFVVMMMDINFAELRQGFLRYLPLGATVAALLLAQLLTAFYYSGQQAAVAETAGAQLNTQALGAVLYTKYIYPFQVCGLILLVAMIGAIVLTLRHREGVRRQNIGAQVARKRGDAVAVVRVETGKGV